MKIGNDLVRLEQRDVLLVIDQKGNLPLPALLHKLHRHERISDILYLKWDAEPLPLSEHPATERATSSYIERVRMSHIPPSIPRCTARFLGLVCRSSLRGAVTFRGSSVVERSAVGHAAGILICVCQTREPMLIVQST